MNFSDLECKAAGIRLQILETALNAGKGHVPPAFSWVEIAVALFYGGILRFKPEEPRWPERDRFILSKGHGCLTLYVILADLGFFPKSELDRFGGDGSLLAGHPDIAIPGVEIVSGSLGHGLGIGAGLALAAKMDGQDWLVFTLLGDGECNEGSIWEAAMFASHHKLSNLVAIIDRNHLGATDFTENFVSLEPLALRWQSFGWEVVTVDGHSFSQLLEAFSNVRRRTSQQPLVVIANTIKGKGVSFMEGSPLWHHRLPKGQEVQIALQELRSRQEQIHEQTSVTGRL